MLPPEQSLRPVNRYVDKDARASAGVISPGPAEKKS
jgi:hypothetical protein